MAVSFCCLKGVSDDAKMYHTTSRLGHRIALDSDDDRIKVWCNNAFNNVAKDVLDLRNKLARLYNISDIFENCDNTVSSLSLYTLRVTRLPRNMPPVDEKIQ